jgi:WD40 repeat protein
MKFLPFLIFLSCALHAQSPKMVIPVGHTGTVHFSSFSPDGRYVVTASYDRTAKIWETRSGNLIAELKGHDNEVKTAVFTKDGEYIMTASWDGKVKLWKALTGEFVRDVFEEKGSLEFAFFSPDQKSILTAQAYTYDITIRSFDNGNILKDYRTEEHRVQKAAFSPSGDKVICSYDDSTAGIWYPFTNKIISSTKNLGSDIKTVVYSPDGKFILAALSNGEIVLWNANLQDQQLITTGKKNLTYACFNVSAKEILAGFSDGNILRIDIASHKMINAFRGHSYSITHISCSPDGSFFSTSSSDYKTKIWSSNNSEVVSELTGHTSGIHNAAFSPDEKTIAFAHTDFTCKIWNASNGTVVKVLRGHSFPVNDVNYSPDGKLMVTASSDSTARIWNADNGELVRILRGHSSLVMCASFSPDGKHIVTGSYNGDVKTWNVETGDLVSTLTGHTSTVNKAFFMADGKRIITCSDDFSAKIWSFPAGKLITDINKGVYAWVNDVFVSPDMKFIALVYSSKVWIWDINANQFVQKLNITDNSIDVSESGSLTSGPVDKVVISPDWHYLLAFKRNYSIDVWDVRTGKMINQLVGHKGRITNALFSKDSTHVVSFSSDDLVKVWDLKEPKEKFSFIAVDTVQSFVFLPDHYYMSTREAGKLLHYVTPDARVITFDQLDVKYNRPDLVIKAIGNPDSLLVRSYFKAYQKRIKKLGMDTSSFKEGFGVPEADFSGRTRISPEQSKKLLKLHITGSDRNYNLDRFNVWINEAALFGVKGISLRTKRTKKLDTTITVLLSTGKNIIETSVTNVNGTESFRIPLAVNFKPVRPEAEKLHFIGIGLDRFADEKHNLNYSVKDVRDLSLRLKAKYNDAITIDTLFNEQVSVAAVSALRAKLMRTSVNDKVIISYSGHGLLSKDFDYYLSTYAVDFNSPEKGGLAYDVLESLLDSIPARKKLMLIDACHSGEVDKEEMEHYRMVTATNTNPGLKGGELENTDTTAKLGMKNSFELMQELFVNVGRATGATIISAAAGTQLAQERGDLKNGVFTYSILEYMEKHPTATVTELKNYVNKRVPELTNGLQVPTTRTETMVLDWRVW